MSQGKGEMTEDVFGIVGTKVLGAYLVERVVAEGGFGVVYRAQHSAFRAAVALKCLKIPQGFSAPEKGDFLEQFRAEAELLFRLSASLSTVVRPFHVDAFTSDRGDFVPFMVLEWLEGETLNLVAQRRRVRGQPLTLVRLMRLLDPVAHALDQAHDLPGADGRICILHRDLKPQNIFVARVQDEDVAKILDFGIGKVKGVAERVAGRRSKRSGYSSFSPAYGAPEQWAGNRYGQTGPWTDVWGLALTMVEVLAGHPIIDGDEASMMGTALDPVRRPTPRREGAIVSDDVEAVFETALAVDPRNRYQLVRHFWGDLVRAVGGLERNSSRSPADMERGSSSRFPRGAEAQTASSRLAFPPVPDLDAPSIPGALRTSRLGSGPRPPENVGRASGLEPAEFNSLEGGEGWGEGSIDVEAVPPPPLCDPRRLESPQIVDMAAPPMVAPGPVVSMELPHRSSADSPAEKGRNLIPARVPTSPVGSLEAEHGLTRVLTRLIPGLALAVAAIAISIGGQAYAARTGTPIPVGWVAGPLLLVGIGVTIYRFLPGRAD